MTNDTSGEPGLKATERAAKIVGMAWITHHDFRHLSATRWIESAWTSRRCPAG
jgi:integrase